MYNEGMISLDAIERDALIIAEKASTLLLSMQKHASISRKKAFDDFATDADLESERITFEFIKKHYPHDTILSEEAGIYQGDSEVIWIVDPLDETKMYKDGSAEFNYLLTIEKNGISFFSVIVRPGFGKTYIAKKNDGSYENGTPIHVSEHSLLSSAHLMHHSFKRKYGEPGLSKNLNLFNELVQVVEEIDSDDQDTKNFVNVAKGSIDGLIRYSPGGGWWDLASGILLVEQAGGKVTDMKGNPLRNHDKTFGIVASNGHIHDELILHTKKYIE